MDSPSPSDKLPQLVGRTFLGMAVGASFGIVMGALVASWVWGVAAIEDQAANASYLAGATTILGAVVGAALGYRIGRGDLAE